MTGTPHHIIPDQGSAQTILDFFLLQKERFPDKIAVVYNGRSLTYTQLNELSNRMANYMLSRAVIHENEFIGIRIPKSEYLIAAILGVLKLGCAYVPVDPDYPAVRINFMEQDSSCRFVLDREALQHFLEQPGSAEEIRRVAYPSSAAYVIYTSGTTGNPKGVVIRHQHLVNLLFHEKSPFDLRADDVWTLFHSQCFDFSVWEIFCPLLTGGTLIVLDKETARNPYKVRQIIEEQGVTMFSQTPSSFYMFEPIFQQDYRPNQLRCVFFGGEALSPVQLAWWRSAYPSLRFLNLYGTTETTIHATFKEITDAGIAENSCNIGKALPGYYAYVLGNRREMLPFGAEGELALAGKGLSGSYLNQEALSREKYIPNPFKGMPGDLLYLTGDIVKKLPNGELIYIGRKDRQVKIRGHRIELPEIELALMGKTGMSFAKATVRKDKEGAQEVLVFFKSEIKETADALIRFLKDKLPAFMVPMHYVQIASIILNNNGKLDEALLLEQYPLLPVNAEGVAAPPRNETDGAILAIWKEILDIQELGIDTNLFEIGGNSLEAIRIVNKVNASYKIQLPVDRMLNDFTVRHMADAVTGMKWLSGAGDMTVNEGGQEHDTFII